MKIKGLFAIGLLAVSMGPNAAAAERFLISSTPFGGASGGDSFQPNPPFAGVGVLFGSSITDNGTCLGCEINVGIGTFSNFTESFTAQNSPNFANFVSQATGSTDPSQIVLVGLWVTNIVSANIPKGAPVFENQSGPLRSLPSSPAINEIELVIDYYCTGPGESCTVDGSSDTFHNVLIGSLNLYAATPAAVPVPGSFALLGLGLASLSLARQRNAA